MSGVAGQAGVMHFAYGRMAVQILGNACRVFLVLAQMDIPFPAIGNEETVFQTIMLAMALISVMTFIASYFIAVRIYQKKEF